jgi:hypothetical protein
MLMVIGVPLSNMGRDSGVGGVWLQGGQESLKRVSTSIWAPSGNSWFDLRPARTGFASGPHLVRGVVKNDHKRCKPVRGKNASGTRDYTKSPGAPHPSALICNHRFVRVDPEGQTAEALIDGGTHGLGTAEPADRPSQGQGLISVQSGRRGLLVDVCGLRDRGGTRL